MKCVGGYDFLPPPVYAVNMQGSLKERIKAIRLSRQLTQAEFADHMGATQSTVARWERGAQPGTEHLHRLAELGRTTVDALLDIDVVLNAGGDTIPVIGYVGAGATIMPFDDYNHGDGMAHIERPPFVAGRAVAVEVQGDSLFPVAENGWRLVYTGEQTLLEAEVLNRLCVVQLTDGRALVKRLVRGGIPGRYHLVSTNAPLIEDAEIVWAAPVKAIIPR
jgi:transcriptional regulator with XRE-family HTH domain